MEWWSRGGISYLLFWYQVFTWVSVRLSLAASSILSWTERYFCLSKLDSKVCSWLSVKAVRAFLCFLEKLEELEFWLRSSSPATVRVENLSVDKTLIIIIINIIIFTGWLYGWITYAGLLWLDTLTGKHRKWRSKMNIGASRNGCFYRGNLDPRFFILLRPLPDVGYKI